MRRWAILTLLSANALLVTACGGAPDDRTVSANVARTESLASPTPSTFSDPASGITCVATESVNELILEPPSAPSIGRDASTSDAVVAELWKLSVATLQEGNVDTRKLRPEIVAGLVPTPARSSVSETAGRYEYVDEGLTQLVVLTTKADGYWYVAGYSGCNSFVVQNGPYVGVGAS